MGKIKTGIKMKVTPEQSQKVQEICFENGISWFSGKVLKHLDKPYFYINGDSELGYSGKDSQLFFIEDDREEVSAKLFIRTNGTCVESEAPTKDNNKGEQMDGQKLECLVEGYEGTYFEVGQVWETREGLKVKVKDFDFEEDVYKVTLVELEDKDKIELYYTQKGEYWENEETGDDLIKLISTEAPTESIPSEEPQPKTLSEYLKENNAYESFVENCVEDFLENEDTYKKFKENRTFIDISNVFIWEDTKPSLEYWVNLSMNKPKNLRYDMNEIIFAEVDNRIAEQKAPTEPTQPEFISTEEFNQMFEQKSSTKYMVFVEGRSNTKKVHDSYDSAEKEAKRLSAKEIGCNVSIVSIVKTFKSKVIVEEVK